MDKYDKEKKKAWKADQKTRVRVAFPVPESELEKLFSYLDDRLQKQGCDHTLLLTSQWIMDSGNSEVSIISWLEDTGGHCDCEVLTNS